MGTQTWGQWFRAVFNVILLTCILTGLLAFTLHMAHDSMDKDLISWGKEEVATVLGALLLILTGRGNPQEKPPLDPGTTVSSTKVISTVQEGAPPTPHEERPA